MNERLKKIRKDAGLTQTEFGATIGATQYQITSYESGGSRRVTPDASVIKLICATYNVDEHWLRTGEGQPYVRSLIPELQRVLSNNPALRQALAACVDRLTDDDWKVINSTVAKITGNKKEQP